MTYPFVQAFHDAGVARGPRLAFVVHMAEGGGTVGFLSRQNRDGVSVHFVVEYSGQIVQMLRLDHMHTSLRTTAIRVDDGPAPYGRTAALAVMGAWADISHGTLGPNHASIACEIEGFAADGPNPRQQLALEELATYLRHQYPTIRNLGHRDFQNYKACPGGHIPWEELGGHAATGGTDVTPAPITDQTAMEVRIPAGANIFDVDGRTILRQSPGSDAWRPSPYEQGGKRAIFSPDPPIVLLALAPADIRPIPTPDCKADVNAALDHVSAAVDGVRAAILEARPR